MAEDTAPPTSLAEDPSSSIWMYTPSLPPAVFFSVLYGLAFLYISYLTFIRYRTWYFSVVPIGAAIEVAGYALRCYSVKNQELLTPFILTLTFTVLAPLLFAAGDYLLLARLIRSALPPGQHRVLGVAARLITKLFVICDILAFLVQAAGSSIASSVSWVGPTSEVGVNVLIGGLAFQTVVLGLFLAALGRFWYKVPRDGGSWRGLGIAVMISTVLIFIRCIYRLVEFAEGVDGYAFRNEWLLWVFESAPMFVAVVVFCVWHPGACLGKNGGKGSSDEEMVSTRLGQL
ncbi:RTA1 like protein-domain-containing protein [Podospora australis]|uniref:RTA1 like protein-domain-containing protein n=1 Tax=Podospora australis TaxID=1536484 RepID=A0AAN7AKX4_9PEZI|nr:RTA1 like protein-domain-containing protein [Podospora australis]